MLRFRAPIHHFTSISASHTTNMPQVTEVPFFKNCKFVLKIGDITREETDAIVNAANESLLGGGGVDGAIHRAAGPELIKYNRALPLVANTSRARLLTGNALIVPGFNLPAAHIIHTVGPIYNSSRGAENARLLRSCYVNSLQVALDNNIRSIAFPAISCGIYHYPLAQAADIAVSTCVSFVRDKQKQSDMTKEPFDSVSFVLFSWDVYDEWSKAAKAVLEQVYDENLKNKPQ